MARLQPQGNVHANPCGEGAHAATGRAERKHQGFPKLYKPSGEAFDACSEGLLLQVSPWEYHMERKTITRAQCLELNAMAEGIAGNG